MKHERKEHVVIPKELIEDIKTYFKLGCDGTLPNEGELLKAIEKQSRPLSSSSQPVDATFDERVPERSHKPMMEPKKYIISEDVLYNKCYLHGYNHKVWETMDPVVRSTPYLTPDEIIGLLPVPGNMGFESISINNDLSKEEILASNRFKLNVYIGEQRAEVKKQVLKDLSPVIDYLKSHIDEENTKIRLANEVGNTDAGNKAGDLWAAYYGTLQQFPEYMRNKQE